MANEKKISYKWHANFWPCDTKGGDPTGTGRGGASIYGRNFEDEIHPDLRHTGNVRLLFLL